MKRRNAVSRDVLSFLVSSIDGGRLKITKPRDKFDEELEFVLNELSALGVVDQELYIRRGRFNDMLTFVVNNGLGPDEIAKAMNWKGFEALVEDILANNGFATRRNVRFKRKEIDIIATLENFGLSVDCKHWSRLPYSSLRQAVLNQIDRTKKMYSLFSDVQTVLPLLVTLYEPPQRIIEGIPLVSINGLSEFSLHFQGSLDTLNAIKIGPVA